MRWTSGFPEITETSSAHWDDVLPQKMGWTSGFLEIMETSSALYWWKLVWGRVFGLFGYTAVDWTGFSSCFSSGVYILEIIDSRLLALSLSPDEIDTFSNTGVEAWECNITLKSHFNFKSPNVVISTLLWTSSLCNMSSYPNILHI